MTTDDEHRPTGSGMELDEAARRIFVQHWLLITIAVAVGVGVGVLRTVGTPSFTASTRLVLDAPDPRTNSESMAIADTVRAIATSQSQVRRALAEKAAAGRDPIDVAGNHVSVSALGTSGVVQLSVSDRSGKVAAVIANALAREIVQTRLSISTGRTRQLVADLDRQIDALSAKIARSSEASRPVLLQQRAALQSNQASILATEASQPKPSIISQAREPSSPDATGLMPFLILGGILGFIIGVGVAGIVEIARPSVVGGAALAREFGTRYVGATGHDDLAWRVGMVAPIAGFSSVGMIPAGRGITTADVESVVRELESTRGSEKAVTDRGWGVSADRAKAPTGATPTAKASRARGARATHPRFFSFFEMTPGEVKGEIGLLLVAPKTLLKSDVIELNDLLALVPHPVLGLITHEPPRGRGWREPSREPVAAPGHAAVPSGHVA